MNELTAIWGAMLDAIGCNDTAKADELLIGAIGQVLPMLPLQERTQITNIVTTWEAARNKRYKTDEHPFVRVPMQGSIVDATTGEERLTRYNVAWHKVYDDNGEIGDLT